jgi:membrane associated rhomboid family serine protease
MRAPKDYLPFSVSLAARSVPASWSEALLRVPFILTFLLVAWSLFLPLVRPDGWIPSVLRPHIGFVATLWQQDPLRAFIQSHFGILIQHSWGQIIYVTIFVTLVGIPFEAREGTLRTFVIFYGSCLTGVALLVLLILAAPLNGGASWSHHMAQISWSGASVGCFGLLGATLATARKPQYLVAAWLAYEYFVEWTMVPSVAVAMHLAGFTFGFVVSRIAHSGHLAQSESTPVPERDDGADP